MIGALWEINDASTPLLMDRLYAELQAGSSPDAALRAAKLSLIDSPAYIASPCTGAVSSFIPVRETEHQSNRDFHMHRITGA